MEDYLTLKTTQAGINMIIRTLYGDSITFTKIAIGDGNPTNLESVTDLTHKVLEGSPPPMRGIRPQVQ